jgi:hypothetical protein
MGRDSRPDLGLAVGHARSVLKEARNELCSRILGHRVTFEASQPFSEMIAGHEFDAVHVC